MAARTVLLLVADDPARRSLLQRALERPDLEIAAAGDLAGAEAALQRSAADAVLLDLIQPGRDVGGLLHVLHGRAPDLPVLSLGAPGGPEAVELLRHGAWAVIPRDAEPAAMSAWLRKATEAHAQARELGRLRRETRGLRDRVPLLGRSESMRAMSQQVDELATRNVPVLLVGESGTGRKMVARELHARSPRASGPYMTLSAANTCDRLLESQLFGHRRGAFPGAAHDHDGAWRAATGGTLLLSDVDQLPLRLQERLVQVLDTGRVVPLGADQAVDVDVRLACATTRDLSAMARAGTFRDDLHRRLSSARLELPPLRERREDISLLAEAFAAETAERFGVGARRFDAPSLEALMAYPWPGNVRELREAVEYSFGREAGDTIRHDALPPLVRAGARSGTASPADRLPTLAEAEAHLVGLVLEDSGGNKTEAARRLGIDRKRLYRKIRKYGLLGDAPVEGDDDD